MKPTKNFLVVFHFDGDESRLLRVTAESEALAENAVSAYAFKTLDSDEDTPELYIDLVVEESQVPAITA